MSGSVVFSPHGCTGRPDATKHRLHTVWECGDCGSRWRVGWVEQVVIGGRFPRLRHVWQRLDWLDEDGHEYGGGEPLRLEEAE